MENVKHTPGVWIIGKNNAGIIGSNNNHAWQEVCVLNTDNVRNEANARLIAAAPELLEACKKLIAYMKDSDSCSSLAEDGIFLAERAINKAEGK